LPVARDWEGAERLETLRLNGMAINDNGLYSLANSARFAKLKSLTLDRFSVSVRTVRDLIELPYLHELQTLELVDSPIESLALKRFFNEPCFAQLDELNLSGFACCEDDELGVIATTQMQPLRVLKLCGHFGRVGVQKLVLSPFVRKLRVLRLESRRIDDACCAAIANSPNLENVREISLPMGRITSHGAFAIAYSPRLPNLHRLRIPYNGLKAEEVQLMRERFGTGMIFTEGKASQS